MGWRVIVLIAAALSGCASGGQSSDPAEIRKRVAAEVRQRAGEVARKDRERSLWTYQQEQKIEADRYVLRSSASRRPQKKR